MNEIEDRVMTVDSDVSQLVEDRRSHVPLLVFR